MAVVWRLALLWCVAVVTALPNPDSQAHFKEPGGPLISSLENFLLDVQEPEIREEIRKFTSEHSFHFRKRREIFGDDGHVINSFRHLPRKALNVATRTVSDISMRDCAVYCINAQCKAWSHNNVTNECRFLDAKANKKYVAVPVSQPNSDFFEISVRGFGGALLIVLFGHGTSHKIDVKPSQVRLIEDPLAPENVLTDHLEPLPTPGPTNPPTDPPSPSPGQSVTDPPASVTAPPPTDSPAPTPDLSYEFDFPDHCGMRPTFGLSDFERLLRPSGFVERTRVVGGTAVSTGTYPWQAQIEISNGRGYEHSCGGIIVSNDLIMTAAHCHTRHESNYQVRVAQNDRANPADPDERVLAVENVYRHSAHRPDFRQGQRNDIAMMRLKFRRGEPHGLTFSDYIQPLCLPRQNTTLVVGQECQISGWGLVDGSHVRSPDNVSQFLRGAVINILDPAICYKAYGERFDERLMICAGKAEGGVDTCSGDSGGPLSCRDSFGRWFAAGIVSFGWECGAAGHPGVYTRVSAYLEFIHRTAAFLTGVQVVV